MKMRNIYLFIVLLLTLAVNAQKPFEKLGLDNEVELLTLSDGRYVEHFANDTLRQIGSVMFNTVTNKVAYFIADDELEKMNVANRNREVSRFMSTDPVMQPHQSPYLYAANNPIIYIDKDGEDNVIYLVGLPAGDGVESPDLQTIANAANKIYKDLGLKTRVVVYSSNQPFDPANIDPNDSYAVIGDVEEVKTVFKQYGDEAGDGWNGGNLHPENSSNENFHTKARGIAIDQDALESTSYKFGSGSKENAAAFLIVHGSGHNSGSNHTYGERNFKGEELDTDNAAIMTSGEKMEKMIWYGDNDNYRKQSDFTKRSNNSLFIKIIKHRFGNSKAKDNYDINKVNNKRRKEGERPINKGQI